MKKEILALFIIVGGMTLVFGLLYHFASEENKLCKEKGICYKTSQQKCEESGGIYFPGGLLSADNCVWKPK